MGRLIDADALKKYLRDYKWEFAMGSDFSKAMEMIDAQPTAYDAEKVVAELEEESYSTTDIVCGGRFDAVRLSSAIDIVKAGGVE